MSASSCIIIAKARSCVRNRVLLWWKLAISDVDDTHVDVPTRAGRTLVPRVPHENLLYSWVLISTAHVEPVRCVQSVYLCTPVPVPRSSKSAVALQMMLPKEEMLLQSSATRALAFWCAACTPKSRFAEELLVRCFSLFCMQYSKA